MFHLNKMDRLYPIVHALTKNISGWTNILIIKQGSAAVGVKSHKQHQL
jgi:hypothetical protein